MAYSRYAQRSHAKTRRHFSDPPSTDVLPQAMLKLAKVLMASETKIPVYRDDVQAKILLPHVSDDEQVSFVNHYGDVFQHLLRFSPKVMNFDFSVSEREKTRSKVEAVISKTTSTLHQVTDEEHCCVELDFMKLVITDPKPSYPRRASNSMRAVDLATKFDAKSPEIPYYIHRMCLPDGEQPLLDLLRQVGVVIEDTVEKEDRVKVDVYDRGFDYMNRVLGGCINLNSSDLSFRKWNIFRWLSSAYMLPNPGQETGGEFQTEGGDLRIKGLASLKKKKHEMEEMSQALRMGFPTVLSSPNLGGVLWRVDDEFELTQEHIGITALFDFTNRIKYVMEKDGVRFKVFVYDINYYTYDKESGTLVRERTVRRWTKFKFLLPSRDSAEVDPFVSVITDIVMNLLDFLGSGSIMPKIWSTNFIYRGVSTPSLIIQKLRRRIIENDDLPTMLDLPSDASKSQLSERLQRLLTAVDDKRVPLPWSEKRKLEAAGRQAGLWR